MRLTTPPANRRHLEDAQANPGRIERSRQAHAEALRKLAKAASSAAAHGATWEEIRQAVEQGVADEVVEELGYRAEAAATARACVHDGDDGL